MSTRSIEKYAATWATWKVPVIVNVAGESVGDYVEVTRRLEGVPGIAGIELNISCPNVGRGGLQFAIDADAAGEVTAAVRRVTDLPLLVKLSPNVADIRPIARAIADAGADALTAINTLSGIAVAPDRQRPLLGNIYGGLSGPAVKPVALRIVYEAAQAVRIPVVAIGGVTELADVLDFLAVGAVAVQVGTAIFADPTLPVRLVERARRGMPAARRRLVPRPHRDRAAEAAGDPLGEGRGVPAMKRIGFLSFGHWSESPYSQVRSASDALIQSIELAGRGRGTRRRRRVLPRPPLRQAARVAVPAARGGRSPDEARSRSGPPSSTCATRTRCTWRRTPAPPT